MESRSISGIFRSRPNTKCHAYKNHRMGNVNVDLSRKRGNSKTITVTMNEYNIIVKSVGRITSNLQKVSFHENLPLMSSVVSV